MMCHDAAGDGFHQWSVRDDSPELETVCATLFAHGHSCLPGRRCEPARATTGEYDDCGAGPIRHLQSTLRSLDSTTVYSTSGGPSAALHCTAMELTLVEALMLAAVRGVIDP